MRIIITNSICWVLAMDKHCASPVSTHLIFTTTAHWGSYYHYPHFIKEETETQRDLKLKKKKTNFIQSPPTAQELGVEHRQPHCRGEHGLLAPLLWCFWCCKKSPDWKEWGPHCTRSVFGAGRLHSGLQLPSLQSDRIEPNNHWVPCSH